VPKYKVTYTCKYTDVFEIDEDEYDYPDDAAGDRAYDEAGMGEIYRSDWDYEIERID
jgi:hypothetical protein